MNNTRIIQVKSIVEAGLLLRENFTNIFSVPLRGIIASVGETVDLSYYSNSRFIDLKVKNIEEILKDGTELNYDSNFGWTRVDYYPNNSNWAFVYAKNRGRIDFLSERAGISDYDKKLLKPVILVYDDLLLDKPVLNSGNNFFGVKMPSNIENRSKCILSAYVNYTKDTENWHQAPF